MSITEPERIARELRKSEERFRHLLETAPDAMVIVDEAGRITLVNTQMESVFGYSREQMLGQPVEMVIPERFRDHHAGHRSSYFAHPRIRPMGQGLELYGRRKDGTEFPIEVSLSPLRTESGTLVSSAIRDISAQKQLAEQLKRKNEELEEQYRRVQAANRLKSEFLANMSHELRTPLNAIIGFAELMHDGRVGPVSDAHKEYLGDILASSRHLLQLINDVLDLAKVESGKMEFRPEMVDMNKLAGEVRDIVRTLAARKRITVEVAVAPEVARVAVDPAKFKQVLYNYLSNALKFTPSEGRVVVRVEPEGKERLRLEVEDSGIGIKPEDLSRLFEEFQQLDAGTGKKYQGTGLGLALTKRLVEAQAGSVGVRSIHGKGSTFFAVLPSPATAPLHVVGPEGEAPRLDGGEDAPRILVIEDDAADRGWLESVLARAGYAVDTAATGSAALLLAGGRPYDMITLDLLLPPSSGWEVLKAIRAQGPNRDTPVIVVTAVAAKQSAFAFHIEDLLVKPVRRGQLLEAIERAQARIDASRPVLVIDDDVHLLRDIEKSLAEKGYRPVCRRDGESGLAAAREEPPAIIVLDLLLPGMDGFEFLRRLRAMPAAEETPVIVWTVKTLSQAERTLLVGSAQAVVEKSQGIDALLAELRQTMVRAGGQRKGAEGRHGW